MKRIKLTTPLKYAFRGHSIVEYAPGEYAAGKAPGEMPPEAAQCAIDHHGAREIKPAAKKAGKTKAAADGDS